MRGTAVPSVKEFQPSSGPLPEVWPSPAVAAGNFLAVRPGELRDVAEELTEFSKRLSTALESWQPLAGQANSSTLGYWTEAEQLSDVLGRAYIAVDSSVKRIAQAHADTISRITITADNYDATEHYLVELCHKVTDRAAPITPSDDMGGSARRRAAGGATDGSQIFFAPIVNEADLHFFLPRPYSFGEVQYLLGPPQPEAIHDSARGYGQLAVLLADLPRGLSGSAIQLAANWGGKVAPLAVGHLRLLHEAVTLLLPATWKIYSIMEWYSQVLEIFKTDLPHPATSRLADVAAADEAAQQRLNALNRHMLTVYGNLPSSLSLVLPSSLDGSQVSLPESAVPPPTEISHDSFKPSPPTTPTRLAGVSPGGFLASPGVPSAPVAGVTPPALNGSGIPATTPPPPPVGTPVPLGLAGKQAPAREDRDMAPAADWGDDMPDTTKAVVVDGGAVGQNHIPVIDRSGAITGAIEGSHYAGPPGIAPAAASGAAAEDFWAGDDPTTPPVIGAG